MRISDWSADVCSSDLAVASTGLGRGPTAAAAGLRGHGAGGPCILSTGLKRPSAGGLSVLELVKAGGWPMIPLLLLSAVALAIIVERFWALRRKAVRSEEHTSELQSLMRISYAVFCLKK